MDWASFLLGFVFVVVVGLGAYGIYETRRYHREVLRLIDEHRRSNHASG